MADEDALSRLIDFLLCSVSQTHGFLLLVQAEHYILQAISIWKRPSAEWTHLTHGCHLIEIMPFIDSLLLEKLEAAKDVVFWEQCFCNLTSVIESSHNLSPSVALHKHNNLGHNGKDCSSVTQNMFWRDDLSDSYH